MHIHARAPLRVSFAGGGTDVSPFCEQEGGLILSATIDRYAFGCLQPRSDNGVSIDSADFNLSLDVPPHESIEFDGRLDLVKAAIGRVGNRYAGGYSIFLESFAPPGSGLGSSSTVMVALVGLLRAYHRLPLTNYDVAQLAFTLERVDLKIAGGKQDQYSATFGGFNFLEFDASNVLVNSLRIDPETVNELEHNCILAFTGRTRDSGRIIDDQSARVVAEEKDTLEGLRKQKDLARDMKSALLRGDLWQFGELLDLTWQYKKMMSPKITTESIDHIYAIAREAGALGGKVTGAGGGGYILLYAPFTHRHKVAQAIAAAGASVVDFSFTESGLTTWVPRDFRH